MIHPVNRLDRRKIKEQKSEKKPKKVSPTKQIRERYKEQEADDELAAYYRNEDFAGSHSIGD